MPTLPTTSDPGTDQHPATTTEQRITALLAALGDTDQQVAETLEQLGLRGVPQNPCRCPIAAYLNSHGVGPVMAAEYEVWAGAAGEDFVVPTTEAVGHFITAFDFGMYPELEAAR